VVSPHQLRVSSPAELNEDILTRSIYGILPSKDWLTLTWSWKHNLTYSLIFQTHNLCYSKMIYTENMTVICFIDLFCGFARRQN